MEKFIDKYGEELFRIAIYFGYLLIFKLVFAAPLWFAVGIALVLVNQIKE